MTRPWPGALAWNLVLWALAAVAMTPLCRVVVRAFQSTDGSLTLDHFAALWRDGSALGWLVNSAFLASAQTVLVMLSSSMGGYALAKHRFAGKRIVLGLMAVTVLLPFQVTLPSLYELMNRLGWVGGYRAILIPGAVSVMGMILYRQAMLTIPDELLDAARIDGAGEFRIWWTVCLPIVRPMTGALALLSFLGAWNAYLWPAIILQDESTFTLPVGLANLSSMPGAAPGALMAATLISIAPVIALFAVGQSELLDGLAVGAVKG